jgi:uncharacterized protein (DUF885 family)
MNRARLSTLFLATALLAGCGPKPVGVPDRPGPGDDAQEAAGPTVAQAGERFFEEFFQRNPVAASGIGEHAYDGKWPDLSPAATEADKKWLADQLAALEMDESTLSPDEKVDLDVLRDVIRRSQFSLEHEDRSTTNPLAYAFLLGGGLDDLIARDYAPLPQRAVAVAERLEGVPKVVEQAIANLQDPSIIKRPQTKVAIGQLAGVSMLIDEEIIERTKDAPDETKARITAAIPDALAAIDQLKAHLQKLEPNAKGQWRLGKDAFGQKLQLTLQTDLSADEVYSLAKAEHGRVRAKMAHLARELYVPLFGEKKLAKIEKKGGDDLEDRIVKEVLGALAKDHVAAEHLRDACEENLARLQSFVAEKKLVPMDDAEVLQVIWTPPHERGVAIAGLDAPPPLDAQKPGLPSFYIVQPVPEDWPKARRESFLREYNHFMLEILSIHEAIPGHFVQLYYGKREPSKIRKVFSNGPFVEGWAVYTEHLMVGAGYAGKQPEGKKPKGMPAGVWKVKSDPELRAKAIALHGQKFFLRTVTNAIIDHEIHAGDMGEEQAVSFMVDKAFQEEGEARAKWVRAQLSSTQLSTYFVGSTAWFRLREQAEERAQDAGAAFDASAFHHEALSHGAPPVHRLPELMGW